MNLARRRRDHRASARLAALLVWGAAVDCGHARTVEPATPAVEAEAEPPGEPRAKVNTGLHTHTFTSHHPTAKASGEGAKDEGAVQLSTSPAALLKPGAVATIQERLVREGDLKGEPSGRLDAATRKALEAFQRHHELPATGIPDDATVGRLGLKSGDVFRSGATDDQK